MQTLAEVHCTSTVSVTGSSGITGVNMALVRRQVPIASRSPADCAQSECTGTERFSPWRLRCVPRPGNNFATSHHRGSSGLPHLAANGHEGTELRLGSARLKDGPQSASLVPPRRNCSTFGGRMSPNAERRAATAYPSPATMAKGSPTETEP